MNCKYCVHRRTCEISLHDDDYCADYRAACPLPRIGSKEWGWESGIKCGERVWRSRLTKITIEMYFERDGVDEYNHRDGYVILRPGHPFLNSVVYGLRNAKCFAELLARRDWRRENRGKI